MRVTVVGAGLMGAQIGVEYALGRHEVRLLVRDEEAAAGRVESAFGLVEEHGLRPKAELEDARRRVTSTTDPERAGAHADLLVESLPEDMELKAEVVASVLPPARADAVIATNTSSLSIGALGDALGAPERTVGTHYLNPPLLMPPVEIVAGARTSPGTVAFARETMVALGKLPIVVRRDVPGFVWNRLQFALVRECAWLVEQGVATPEDVDTVVREGLARRWRRVGPLRAIALGGIDVWNRSGRNIVPELSRADELPDLETVAITSGDLAAEAAARDAALAAELGGLG